MISNEFLFADSFCIPLIKKIFPLPDLVLEPAVKD